MMHFEDEPEFINNNNEMMSIDDKLVNKSHEQIFGKRPTITDEIIVKDDYRPDTDYMFKNCREQVGGDHYKKMKIQPIEFITANNLGYCEGNVVKYISRHDSKNGAEDIRKVIQYCEFILETQYKGQ